MGCLGVFRGATDFSHRGRTMKSPADLLQYAWDYPLFEALYGRRSRRFAMGFEMNEGPFTYKSRHAPLPLSELEEALLVAAGIGFSGLALWEHAVPLPYRFSEGRTFPSTCRGRRTALLFANDQGSTSSTPPRARRKKCARWTVPI